METQDSPAVAVARAHMEAWSRHDWEKTREMLSPQVHAIVKNTQSYGGGEYTGVESYMAVKIKGASLVEPGSVRVVSEFGDENNALILATMRIRLGAGGAAMMTMVRAGLYLLDENKKIKEEVDEFIVLPEEG